MGSVAVNVRYETTDIVAAARRMARFYYAESYGQCTPWREGTGWMHRMMHRIMTGEGRMEDLDVLGSVTTQIEGHTISAFSEAAAWPVQGSLRPCRDELQQQ